MAESVKFTEGVSRLTGSSLSSPYDLRNAEIKPAHVVRALDSAIEETGIIDPTAEERLVQHNNSWVSAQTSSYFRSILYTSRRRPRRLDVYRASETSPENDVPRILNLNIRGGTGDSIRADKLIMYVLIPINGRGEAGIWRYIGWNTGDNAELPSIEADVSNTTQYLEVFRTAEMPPKVSGEPGPVQALHYLGRYSSSVGLSGNQFEYYSFVPHEDAGETATEYVDNTTVDYVYPSANQSFRLADGDPVADDGIVMDGSDYSGWELVFTETPFESDGTPIQEGTVYYVASNDDYRIYIEDGAGNPVSFDPESVLDVQGAQSPRATLIAEGVRFNITPPESTSASATILVPDQEEWSYKVPEDAEEATDQPTTRILERDRTIHGRTRVEVDGQGSGNTFEFIGNDYTELFSEGDVVGFEIDESEVLTPTFDGGVVLTGTATLDIPAGSTFYIKLIEVSSNADNDVLFEYEIVGGTSPYNVELQRGYDNNSGTPSFSTINTTTENTTGVLTITDTEAPENTLLAYRVQVTDDNATTDTTPSESIYLVDDDDVYRGPDGDDDGDEQTFQ